MKFKRLILAIVSITLISFMGCQPATDPLPEDEGPTVAEQWATISAPGGDLYDLLVSAAGKALDASTEYEITASDPIVASLNTAAPDIFTVTNNPGGPRTSVWVRKQNESVVNYYLWIGDTASGGIIPPSTTAECDACSIWINYEWDGATTITAGHSGRASTSLISGYTAGSSTGRVSAGLNLLFNPSNL